MKTMIMTDNGEKKNAAIFYMTNDGDIVNTFEEAENDYSTCISKIYTNDFYVGSFDDMKNNVIDRIEKGFYNTETKTEMRMAINELAESKPDREFRTGYLIQTIGRKFVHVLDLYDSIIEKIEIEEFYNQFC